MAISDNRNPSTAQSRQFGRGNATQNNAGSTSDTKTKAQLWVNIGVSKTVLKDGESVEEFIALPQGIPLDTMEMKPATSRNDEFRNRELGQNHLWKQLMAKAAELAPGEDVIVNLQVQVRRVNADVAPTADDQNQYVVNVDL